MSNDELRDAELIYHIREGHSDHVKYLLNKFYNPNARDIDKTALQVATSCSNLDCMRALLEHGADVDDTDHLGNTAAHIAARRDEPPVMQVLIDWGADLDLANLDGHTALQVALENKHFEVAGLLKKAQERRTQKIPPKNLTL